MHQRVAAIAVQAGDAGGEQRAHLGDADRAVVEIEVDQLEHRGPQPAQVTLVAAGQRRQVRGDDAGEHLGPARERHLQFGEPARVGDQRAGEGDERGGAGLRVAAERLGIEAAAGEHHAGVELVDGWFAEKRAEREALQRLLPVEPLGALLEVRAGMIAGVGAAEHAERGGPVQPVVGVAVREPRDDVRMPHHAEQIAAREVGARQLEQAQERLGQAAVIAGRGAQHVVR